MGDQKVQQRERELKVGDTVRILQPVDDREKNLCLWVGTVMDCTVGFAGVVTSLGSEHNGMHVYLVKIGLEGVFHHRWYTERHLEKV